MSDRSATVMWAQPGSETVTTTARRPAPPQSDLPAWLARRSPLERLAIGIAGVGLILATLSYALPWEYHPARPGLGFSYYLGAAAAGGIQYGLGLVLMIGGLVTAQLGPRRFNVPVRVFSSAVALLQVGLLVGVALLARAKGAIRSPDGVEAPPVEIGWGMIAAFLAVLALAAAIALSHRRSGVAAHG